LYIFYKVVFVLVHFNYAKIELGASVFVDQKALPIGAIFGDILSVLQPMHHDKPNHFYQKDAELT
jgi:hypothetical protein